MAICLSLFLHYLYSAPFPLRSLSFMLINPSYNPGQILSPLSPLYCKYYPSLPLPALNPTFLLIVPLIIIISRHPHTPCSIFSARIVYLSPNYHLPFFPPFPVRTPTQQWKEAVITDGNECGGETKHWFILRQFLYPKTKADKGKADEWKQ